MGSRNHAADLSGEFMGVLKRSSEVKSGTYEIDHSLPMLKFGLLLGSRYRREALISALGSLLIYACGFATGPVLARLLGPEGRGEIAAVLIPAAVLGSFLPLGLPIAAAYWVGKEQPEGRLLSTVTVAGAVLGAPICAVLWFLAPAYYSAFSPTTLFWARAMLPFIPLSTGVLCALEIRRRRRADGTWNFFRSAPIVIPAILVLVLAAAGRLTVQSTLATYFVAGILPFLYFISRIRGAPLHRPTWKSLRLLVPYAWSSLGYIAITTMTARLDQLVMVTVVAPEQLGLYVVAVSASSLINPLSAGLSLALFSHLRDEAESSRGQARFQRSLYLTAGVSAVAALVIGLPAPMLLSVLLGPPFEEAATAVRLLLPGAVALSLLSLLTTKVYAEGRPGEATRAGIFGLVVTVLGVAGVVPKYGIEGAAVVTSVAYVGSVLLLVARGALHAAPPGGDLHHDPLWTDSSPSPNSGQSSPT